MLHKSTQIIWSKSPKPKNQKPSGKVESRYSGCAVIWIRDTGVDHTRRPRRSDVAAISRRNRVASPANTCGGNRQSHAANHIINR